MLHYINLENFKSIKNQKFELRQINVFIGPNGAGKSSISQSVSLLKQSKLSIEWNGDIVNFNKFEDVVNNQAEDKKITIQFGGWFPPRDKIDTILGIYEINYGFHIEIESQGVAKIGYKIDGNEPFRFSGTIGKHDTPKNTQIEFEGIKFNIQENFNLENIVEVRGSTHPEKMDYSYYYKILTALQVFLKTFRNQLDYCKFVPATRGFDQSSYMLLDEVLEIQSSKGLSRQSEMAVTSMAHNREILDTITRIAKQVIPEVDIQIRNLPQRKIQIVNKDKFGEYSITNEGFGLNQSVYMFMQLALAREHSTIFIDEPEISLHPSSQAKLAAVLIDISIKEKKQLIITTHSEHILLGLLEAVMDKRLPSKSINVFYFEKENGVTKVTKLEVNENGELKGGMKGFFEADLNHFDKFLQSVKKGK